ncbi:MAG: hypothetical protein COA57_12175 [Flavobacteriales bacterium]|nr:MAG: hypothetical protein COA57_12175 [Flavobacteriales bacterium]
MKQAILSFGFIFCLAFFAVAQNNTLQPAVAVAGGAEIAFEKEIHDFGTIKQYDQPAATTEFKFTNTGTEPLIISNARGSCGCTVPQWPREPIKPGESASIKVRYDAKRVGPINKSVTIASNAGNTPSKVIRIKGLIESAPKPSDEAFPAKTQPVGTPIEN